MWLDVKAKRRWKISPIGQLSDWEFVMIAVQDCSLFSGSGCNWFSRGLTLTVGSLPATNLADQICCRCSSSWIQEVNHNSLFSIFGTLWVSLVQGCCQHSWSMLIGFTQLSILTDFPHHWPPEPPAHLNPPLELNVSQLPASSEEFWRVWLIDSISAVLSDVNKN